MAAAALPPAVPLDEVEEDVHVAHHLPALLTVSKNLSNLPLGMTRMICIGELAISDGAVSAVGDAHRQVVESFQAVHGERSVMGLLVLQSSSFTHVFELATDDVPAFLTLLINGTKGYVKGGAASMKVLYAEDDCTSRLFALPTATGWDYRFCKLSTEGSLTMEDVEAEAGGDLGLAAWKVCCGVLKLGLWLRERVSVRHGCVGVGVVRRVGVCMRWWRPRRWLRRCCCRSCC